MARIPEHLVVAGMQRLQRTLTAEVLEWSLSRGLFPSSERATRTALVAGTFCCRCSPHGCEEEVEDPRPYRHAVRFLALFLSADDHGPDDASDHPARRIERALLDPGSAPGDPHGQAAQEFMRDLIADTAPSEVAPFTTSFTDHLAAAAEEFELTQPPSPPATATGLARLGLPDFFRLRPLLIGTEPYLRLWQLADHRPRPSDVDDAADEVRRRFPSAMLDDAVDAAIDAHAAGVRRRAPPLTELEAVAVVSTYLANDLGSVERDRGPDGDARSPNLVLMLQDSRGRAPGGQRELRARGPDGGKQAIEAVVRLHDATTARFRALEINLQMLDNRAAMLRYTGLLSGVVDGNLQSTIDYARARAAAASAATGEPESAPAGAPRYSAGPVLDRLRFVGTRPTRA